MVAMATVAMATVTMVTVVMATVAMVTVAMANRLTCDCRNAFVSALVSALHIQYVKVAILRFTRLRVHKHVSSTVESRGWQRNPHRF